MANMQEPDNSAAQDFVQTIATTTTLPLLLRLLLAPTSEKSGNRSKLPSANTCGNFCKCPAGGTSGDAICEYLELSGDLTKLTNFQQEGNPAISKFPAGGKSGPTISANFQLEGNLAIGKFPIGGKSGHLG